MRLRGRNSAILAILGLSNYQENKSSSLKVQTSFQGKRETPKRNVKEVIKKAAMKKTTPMHTPNRKINSIMLNETSDETEDTGIVVEKEDSNDLSDCAIEFTKSGSVEENLDSIYLHTEMMRPKTAFEIMLKNSKVTAVGRRMFIEDENLEKSDQNGKIHGKAIKVKSRYMKVFETKPEKIENVCDEDNTKNLQQHHHRDFGFWDDVLHLENFVCDKKTAMKDLSAKFDEQLRVAQIEAKNKAVQETQKTVEKKPMTRVSLKNHPTTGKYLHENDLLWCQRHTKMGQPTIIKWFKRFRKVCCEKGKLSPSGLCKVYQRVYEGKAETFACIILQLFGLDHSTGSLDFKVIITIHRNVPGMSQSLKIWGGR